MTASDRLVRCFQRMRKEKRCGLVTFISAGDPDHNSAAAILDALPGAGADIVELGMPFSDPMADGPSIQASSQRALKAGATMARTFELARRFRTRHETTPLVLMGYFNPIYRYGSERFCTDAAAAGVDGLIVVDLPPEEDADLMPAAQAHGLHMIRLIAPTTPIGRFAQILSGASGFVYYVSITGITGTHAPDLDRVRDALKEVKRQTELPVAVGFGIKTPEQAHALAGFADAVVVGSTLTEAIRLGLGEGQKGHKLAETVAALVGSLRAGLDEKMMDRAASSRGAVA
jgi:tryptophan synthase alpha chain